MLNDCSYDDKHQHVTYYCGVKDGEYFGQRSSEFLYCNNYLLGIDRGLLQKVSFEGCKSETFDEEFQFSAFKNVRVLNISNAGLKSLPERLFDENEHLEQLFLQNNKFVRLPASLFRLTSELRELNLSNNVLSDVDVSLFTNTKQLRSIDLSGNWIGEFNASVFSNLHELRFLDISSNMIYSIDKELLINNKNLEIFQLNNNRVFTLDCNLLKNWSEDSINISINTMKDLDASCINDTNLTITISSIDSMSIHKSDNDIVWTFSRENFERLRHLNVSGSKIENISIIIEEASKYLETLDLSYQFVGKLKVDTFQRFINLKRLYLRQTNLTNFGFATFYHQRKLEILDISNNNLKQVDFNLFLRNFNNLIHLNLEGNDLVEIDSITRTHFPLSLIHI